ncbi:hypothetical protein Tcan_11026 [Toxocara canis]|uniref:UPAR/Ly6 domain-containing protein n=1 Tax=Toxocara canis TaxID=6265 RepID=A0A0B2VXQ8_TOXCA|nr:hypothetical protein Tcan_11026 [Toxocara canis]
MLIFLPLILLILHCVSNTTGIQCWEGYEQLAANQADGSIDAIECARDSAFCVRVKTKIEAYGVKSTIYSTSCENRFLEVLGRSFTCPDDPQTSKGGCYSFPIMRASKKYKANVCCCKGDFCNMGSVPFNSLCTSLIVLLTAFWINA